MSYGDSACVSASATRRPKIRSEEDDEAERADCLTGCKTATLPGGYDSYRALYCLKRASSAFSVHAGLIIEMEISTFQERYSFPVSVSLLTCLTALGFSAQI